MEGASDIDYNKYDSLSLALKSELVDKMLSYYEKLGWRVFEKYEDKKYMNIVHVTLVREHVIKNKDKLQLLQVKLESLINRMAKDRKRKHSKTLILSLSSSLFLVISLALGIFLAMRDVPALTLVGACLIFFGVGGFFAHIPVSVKTYRNENTAYARKFKRTSAEIVRLIERANELSMEA